MSDHDRTAAAGRGEFSAKVYLPGLNGLRFVAALAVMIHHVEQGKKAVGLDNLFSAEHPAVYRAGALGVTLFFVLSGFLITFLLLSELRTQGTIHIRNFYVRRILRIWPLYYLVVALGWIVLPMLPGLAFPMFPSPFGPRFFGGLAFYLLLSPQYILPGLRGETLAGTLWSVGVEEHFYAFWPWLVRFVRGRILLPFLGIVGLCVVGRLLARVALHHVRLGVLPASAAWDYLASVLDANRFDCMAIGGIGAWLHLTGAERAAVLFRRDVQLVSVCILLFCLARGVSFGVVDHEVYSLLFGVFILNLALNPSSLVRMEHPFLRFTGEISYGIYVFHWPVIVGVLNALRAAGVVWGPVSLNAAVYSAVVVLTTAAAAASHRFFEKPFLRRKEAFSVILSGLAARPAPEAA